MNFMDYIAKGENWRAARRAALIGSPNSEELYRKQLAYALSLAQEARRRAECGELNVSRTHLLFSDEGIDDKEHWLNEISLLPNGEMLSTTYYQRPGERGATSGPYELRLSATGTDKKNQRIIEELERLLGIASTSE